MKLKTISRFILITILLFSGCDDPPQKMQPPQVQEQKENVCFFLDTSMSMRGYFRHQQQEGSFFQRFMWTSFGSGLKAVFPEEKIYLIPFGSQIGEEEQLSPSQSFLTKFRYASQKEIDSDYSDTNTKLVELFGDERLIENRLFLILTDGVPSSPDGSGPDLRISSVIKQNILDKGYHLWLLGIRTEYNGFVYPETPDKFGKKVKFRYKGVKPVYLWVGSNHISQGNMIVSNFVAGLKKLLDDGSEKELSVNWIELPHIKIPNAKLRLSDQDISGEPISKIKPYPKGDYFEINVAKSFTGELDIPIVIDWNEEIINYELNLSFNYKEIWYADENNTWMFHLNSRKIPERLNIVMTAEPKIDRWWERWSTDNDSVRENAGLTLYLADLVDGLYVPGKKEVGELKLKFRK